MAFSQLLLRICVKTGLLDRYVYSFAKDKKDQDPMLSHIPDVSKCLLSNGLQPQLLSQTPKCPENGEKRHVVLQEQHT